MISLPIGLLILCSILAYALHDAKLSTLLNPHSIILVIGGTMGVLLLSVPMRDVIQMFHMAYQLWKPERDSRQIHKNLLDLAARKTAKVTTSHPLLRYAQELWEQGVDNEIFSFLMNHRRQEVNAASERAVATIRNLAKYPPALGMTGTVLGLVGLFSNLTPEGRDKLGPALALAMTATFYGLVLANMVLLPLADRFHVLHLSKKKNNDYVFRALILIQRGEPLSMMGEEVNANAA